MKRVLILSLTMLLLIALTVTMAAPVFAGCGYSAGYWKNHVESWVGYSPDDDYDAVFGTDLFDPDITLLDALQVKGKGSDDIRDSVRDLLNAALP